MKEYNRPCLHIHISFYRKQKLSNKKRNHSFFSLFQNTSCRGLIFLLVDVVYSKQLVTAVGWSIGCLFYFLCKIKKKDEISKVVDHQEETKSKTAKQKKSQLIARMVGRFYCRVCVCTSVLLLLSMLLLFFFLF